MYIVTPVVSTATKPSERDVNGGPYQRFSRVGGRGGAGHKQASHVRGARRTVGILLGGGGGGRAGRALRMFTREQHPEECERAVRL